VGKEVSSEGVPPKPHVFNFTVRGRPHLLQEPSALCARQVRVVTDPSELHDVTIKNFPSVMNPFCLPDGYGMQPGSDGKIIWIVCSLVLAAQPHGEAA